MGKRTKHKLDLRGLLLPLSLLKATRSFRALKPGEILEVLWREPGSPQEIFKVLPQAAYDVIEMQEEGKTHPYFRIRLQKKDRLESAQNI